MSFTLVFFFLITSACNANKDDYVINYIPFDVDFYNGTGPNDFTERSWAQKHYSSETLNKLFSEIDNKCLRIPEFTPDLRVQIKRKDGKSLYIDSEKRFVAKNRLCDFEKSIELKGILEIEDQFPDTNKKTGSEFINEKMGEKFPTGN